MKRPKLDVEEAVRQRYSEAAIRTEPDLCCRVRFEARYLEVLPPELVERDYGCGDPCRHLETGDDVLDLGSGPGKVCYIASQIVGPRGSVTGVDMNDEMLALAESHRESIGDRIGYHNVRFVKARIQDLSAVVPDASIDVVVSNCVLNLVRAEDKRALFDEIRRVLRPGGRAVISDIVSDRDVPRALTEDPDLWSGCISGAFREDLFLDAFRTAGFEDVELLTRGETPWRVVEGIEFRSVTVRAREPGQASSSRTAVP